MKIPFLSGLKVSGKVELNNLSLLSTPTKILTIDENNNITYSTSVGGTIDLSNYYNKSQTDTNIANAISALVDSAPSTLDTLNELAAALGDDPNFATTITNLIGTKVNASDVYSKSVSDGKYKAIAWLPSWNEIQSKPTLLSQFSNDLGNYGNWITQTQGNGWYQPLENQRLSTSNNVIFNQITANSKLNIPSTSTNKYSIFVDEIGVGGTGSTIPIISFLNDLSDVTIASPTVNQTLVYNGSQWVNSTITSGTFNYNDLYNKPTSLSQFTNDLGLGSVYQPLENQRLSTSNSPSFSNLTLNGSDTAYKQLFFQANDTLRWNLFSIGAETGSNTGSGLYLASYADNGDYIQTLFSANRQTGIFEFYQRPTFAGNGLVSNDGNLYNISINGNAASANNAVRWNSHQIDLSDYGSELSFFLGYDNGVGKVRPFNAAQVKSSIGFNDDTDATASTIVRRDANGYINASFFRNTNEYVRGDTPITITGEDGNGYLYKFNSSAIQSFVGLNNGSTLTNNISGSAGSVNWSNVVSRPTALSQFTNDLGLSSIFQPLENQRLSTSNNVIFNQITANSKLNIPSTSTNKYSLYVDENGAGGSGGTIPVISYLNDLNDVSISSPTNGNVLTYNGSHWINSTVTSGTFDYNQLINKPDLSVFQPLEDQRLSTNNSPIFNGISIYNQGFSDQWHVETSLTVMGSASIAAGASIDNGLVVSTGGGGLYFKEFLSNPYHIELVVPPFINGNNTLALPNTSGQLALVSQIPNNLVYNDGETYNITSTYSYATDYAVTANYSNSAGNSNAWNNQYLDFSTFGTSLNFFLGFDGVAGKTMPFNPSQAAIAMKAHIDIGFNGGYPSSNANTVAENTSSFTYANNAPLNGYLGYFGNGGYGLQLNASYSSAGGSIFFRTRNGDAGSFNNWVEMLHTGNGGLQKITDIANTTTNSIQASRVSAGYDSGSPGSINTSEFLRISGNGGVFWASNGLAINNQDLNDDTLTLQTYNVSSIGLKLKTSGNITRGYLYADSGNNIGFLNSASSWALRLDNSGTDYFANNIEANAIYANNWFRTFGDTGWYSETYAGGIYMTDSTWVRTYNNKGFMASDLRATNSIQVPAKNTAGTPTGNHFSIWIEV